MDDFTTLAAERFSVRKYLNKQLRTEDLERILKAGQLAPTAKNLQPQKIFVIQSEEGLATIDSLTKCRFGAPTVLLICYDTEREWHNPLEEGVTSGEIDASIVTTHMMLEAADIGVASCWIGYFPPSRTAEAFHLPENLKPVALLDLGYPTPDAEPTERHTQYRDEEDIIAFL